MGPRGLLLLLVLLCSAFPFCFAFFARPLRMVLSYAYIAMLLVFGGFLGSVYALPVTGTVSVSAGSILYGALILSSLMLVISGRDPRVVRNIVKIVIAADLFETGLLLLTSAALRDPAVVNYLDTPPSLFSVSVRIVATGGVLIVGELVLLIVVFERIKKMVRSVLVLSFLYVAFFVAVLCLDGVLFPLLALPGAEDLGGLIAAGVKVKLVIALAYSVPLVLFLAVFRGTLAQYRAAPMRLQELFFAPRVDLVREIERQQDALTVEAERYRRLIESTGDAVVGTTLDGIIESWNPAASLLYGYRAQEVVGRQIDMLLPPVRLEEVRSSLATVAQGRTVTDLETTVQRGDGRLVEVSLTMSPVVDAAGTVLGASAIGRDVSERHRMQLALEHQAMHDALTGLPNRALFVDRLEHALLAAGRRGRPVAVLFLDLDQFKMVNDATGHHGGDLLLVEVAARLRSALRPTETVARFGGDEFVLLCEETDAAGAAKVADRVLETLSAAFTVDGQRVYATASVGIAVSPPADAHALLRQADAAMYEAKSRGRGRSCLFDAGSAARDQGRLALANDLREALSEQHLTLHYQPVVDLASGQVVAVEALARWVHPTRGNVGPDQFIRLAEETGQITALDRWALRQACLDGGRLLAAGSLPPDGYMAVNLSARDVSEPEVEQMVQDAVEGAGDGFSYRRLVLEVTETVVLSDVDHASRLLQSMRDLGVTIAIDDFGTGYSSLAYLRRFPAAQVKIDRSFISGITDNSEDLAIVTAVVQLAHAIGLTTIAEGVETSRQLALLVGMGCDAAQGFLWSPALALPEVMGLVAGLPDGRFPVRV